MNRLFIFVVLSTMVLVNANAQLKVNSNGNVTIASSSLNFNPRLSVGNNCYYFGGYASSLGIAGTPLVRDNHNNIGVEGYVNANQSFSSERNFGMLGMTTINLNHGKNYGVAGFLDFSPSSLNNGGGAGIYATNYQYLYAYPDNIPGIYAAYIHGETNLDGVTIAREIYTPADDRISRNAEAMETRSSDDNNTLDNLLKLNVREYYVKDQQTARAAANTTDMSNEIRQAYEYMKKDEEKLNSRRRYGVSAQQLQKVYPSLVMEGQDGYLYVNYTELVPLLLRSIQELKAELDEVKGNDDKVKYARAADFDDESADVSDATKIPSVASLAQNTPNPFTERTTIRFTLPDNTRNAYIYIFDMSGKMQKQIPIDSSMQSVTIEGYELSAGMYIYSLVIGGKEVKTRRMILSK